MYLKMQMIIENVLDAMDAVRLQMQIRKYYM